MVYKTKAEIIREHEKSLVESVVLYKQRLDLLRTELDSAYKYLGDALGDVPDRTRTVTEEFVSRVLNLSNRIELSPITYRELAGQKESLAYYGAEAYNYGYLMENHRYFLRNLRKK